VSLGAARYATAAVIAVVALAAVACEAHEYERPDREDQVAEADALLTAETFDTISWASDSERGFAGNNVYAARCRSCHGPLGTGDTPYAQENRLDVPSIVRPDIPYADVAAMRRVIFTGHPAGMPTWGVAGIEPREIDAAAYYILHVLRPEVLGQQAGQPR
jgi:mono/diheme cytochrome c family protein